MWRIVAVVVTSVQFAYSHFSSDLVLLCSLFYYPLRSSPIMPSKLLSLTQRRKRLTFRLFQAQVQLTKALANKGRHARPPPMSALYMAALRDVRWWQSVVEQLELLIEEVQTGMRKHARSHSRVVTSHHDR